MTAAPAGQSKAAAENPVDPAAAENPVDPAAAIEVESLPPVPGRDDPIETGKVEVVRPAKSNEDGDVGGKVHGVRKQITRKAPKSDPLADLTDQTKLPLAATVGNVVGVVETYAGRAVFSLSLKGWVGEAPFKILASEVGDIEQVLAEIRKELS